MEEFTYPKLQCNLVKSAWLHPKLFLPSFLRDCDVELWNLSNVIYNPFNHTCVCVNEITFVKHLILGLVARRTNPPTNEWPMLNHAYIKKPP